MSDLYPLGKTTLGPDELLTIVRLSALGVPGVSRMAGVTGGVNRLFRRGVHDGVRIEVEDNLVVIDLHLILKKEVNIRDVSRDVQEQVARAVQETVGMDVGAVDVHVENIDFEDGEAGLA